MGLPSGTFSKDIYFRIAKKKLYKLSLSNSIFETRIIFYNPDTNVDIIIDRPYFSEDTLCLKFREPLLK